MQWLISQVSTSESMGAVILWAGVGLEGDAGGRRRGGRRRPAGRADRDAGIPLAVDDQDVEFSARLEPAERPETAGNPAVDRDDARRTARDGSGRAGRRPPRPRRCRPGRSAPSGREAPGGSGGSRRRRRLPARSIESGGALPSRRRTISASGKASGATRARDGRAGRSSSPSRSPPAVPGECRILAPKAQADVIPPAHRRHRADHLLLVVAPGVEHDQERIRIVRFIPLRDEPSLHERARPGIRRLERGGVEPVAGHREGSWVPERESCQPRRRRPAVVLGRAILPVRL